MWSVAGAEAPDRGVLQHQERPVGEPGQLQVLAWARWRAGERAVEQALVERVQGLVRAQGERVQVQV